MNVGPHRESLESYNNPIVAAAAAVFKLLLSTFSFVL